MSDQSKKPAKKIKWWQILIIVVVAVTIIGAIFGGGDEPTDSGSSSSNSNASSNITASSSSKPSSSSKEPEKKLPTLGETVEQKDVKVTFNSVKNSTGSQYNKPADGKVFVLCEFTIENNSKSDIAISSLMSFDAYFDGFKTTVDISALVDKGDKNQLDGSVASGKKMNGVVGFQAPKDWKELEISFKSNVFSNKEIKFTATNGK